MATTKLPPRATNKDGTLSARIKPKAAGKEKLAPSSVRVVPYPKEISKIWQLKNSPAGKLVVTMTRKIITNARQEAPVSARGSHGRTPGYLKARIGLYVGEDSTSMYAQAVTRAKTKKGKRGGKPAYYGRIQNQKLDYMGQALDRTQE